MTEELQAVADATAALERAGVPHWLGGSWAEDFHAGAVHRGHGDIDLVVWNHDVDDAVAALKSGGFAAVDDTHLERDGIAVELVLVETDLAGNVLSVGDGSQWTPGALGGQRATLDGVTCRIVSA
jgi:Aminoglycoside-2''-adenylyltransferase